MTAAGIVAAARAATARGGGGIDGTGIDAGARDGSGRDGGGRDGIGRDAGARDGVGRARLREPVGVGRARLREPVGVGRARLREPVGVGDYQADLFAQGRAGLNPEAAVRRCALDGSSWVDTAGGWLRGADELMVTLARSLAWTEARRPMYGRIVPEPRLGASARPGAPGVPAVIGAMAEALNARYGEALNSVWVNYYRGGNDSVAWHRDKTTRELARPIVAVASLGGPRRFKLRKRSGLGSLSFTLASGDLLVMGGACQRDWEHSVPKASSAPPRMSVTFRRLGGPRPARRRAAAAGSSASPARPPARGPDPATGQAAPGQRRG